MGSRQAPAAPGAAGSARPVSTPSPGLRLPTHRNPVPPHTRLLTRRLPVVVYVLVLLLLPASLVGASMATGWWRTTGTSLVRASDASPGTEASPAAPADPADVRGSMTIQEIVEAFPAVSAAEILKEFGAPAGTATSTQLKTLVEDGGGVDVPAFRTWLQQRLTSTAPAPAAP
jgi:hypothetical protein